MYPPGHTPTPPMGGWGYDQGVPHHPTPLPAWSESCSVTLPRGQNGPLGSGASRGARLHGNTGNTGNTREYTGIHGNTGNTREYPEHGNTREYREYPGIPGIPGNTRNTREYREYPGIPGIPGNTLEYTGIPGNTWEYREYREYPGIHGVLYLWSFLVALRSEAKRSEQSELRFARSLRSLRFASLLEAAFPL